MDIIELRSWLNHVSDPEDSPLEPRTLCLIGLFLSSNRTPFIDLSFRSQYHYPQHSRAWKRNCVSDWILFPVRNRWLDMCEVTLIEPRPLPSCIFSSQVGLSIESWYSMNVLSEFYSYSLSNIAFIPFLSNRMSIVPIASYRCLNSDRAVLLIYVAWLRSTALSTQSYDIFSLIVLSAEMCYLFTCKYSRTNIVER